MFSIKRLFFLSSSVKLQFFKSFIQPYFDYCSTLLIYFPKSTIQKIKNSYDFGLHKLLSLKVQEYNLFKKNGFRNSLNEFNSLLFKYGLLAFEHRFISRASSFIYKIINVPTSPQILSNQVKQNSIEMKKYNLRNISDILLPQIRTRSGEETFSYFFSHFHNNILSSAINYSFNNFKAFISNNINCIYSKFSDFFYKFKLQNRFSNFY